MPGKRSVDERVCIHTVIDINTGCWNWIGHICKDGYGKTNITMNGEKVCLVHRMTYIHYSGPIPDGTEIDHICKNRACVNPLHLQAVTHAENVGRGDYKTTHRNKVKTHCKRGHEFSGENLIHTAGNVRHCRECRKEYDRARSHRKRKNIQGEKP